MVSIVAALYKSERYLPAFVKHLREFAAYLQERDFEFEIIFVPQLPSDFEKNIFKSLAGESWFRLQENQKPSLYAAWNTGTEIAKGSVVGFWNADDIRFPEAVIEAEHLVKNGANIVYFPFKIKRYLVIGGLDIPVHLQTVDGPVLDFEQKKFQQTMTCGPHFMFRRSFFEQVGPFDEQFKVVGDFDWCVRAAYITDKFARGKNLSGIFRVDGRGLSAGGTRRHMAENNIVYRRFAMTDKIVPGYEEEMNAYDPRTLLFRGSRKPFSSPAGKY